RHALRRIKLTADSGVNTVGADQDVGGVAAGGMTRVVGERRDHIVAARSKRGEPQSGPHVVGPEPLARGLGQDDLKLAAMDGVLRPAIARGTAPRPPPDQLTEPG